MRCYNGCLLKFRDTIFLIVWWMSVDFLHQDISKVDLIKDSSEIFSNWGRLLRTEAEWNCSVSLQHSSVFFAHTLLLAEFHSLRYSISTFY